jgi:carbamoyltransferase
MHHARARLDVRYTDLVVVNTSLNTAGRPMVDDARDALECFGSAPIHALATGPYFVRRAA